MCHKNSVTVLEKAARPSDTRLCEFMSQEKTTPQIPINTTSSHMILSVRAFRNVPWGINGGVFALITRDLNHFTYANLSYYTIFFIKNGEIHDL